MDNYSETVVYPVLIHSMKKEVHRSFDLYQTEQSQDDEDDTFSVSVNEENNDRNDRKNNNNGNNGNNDDNDENNSGKNDQKNDKKSKKLPLEVPLMQMTLIEELQRESASSSTILKYVCIR